MLKFCLLKKKKWLKGNKVSFSNKKTIRKFIPNLKLKKIMIKNKIFVKLKLSVKVIKKIDKVFNYLDLKYIKNVKKKIY